MKVELTGGTPLELMGKVRSIIVLLIRDELQRLRLLDPRYNNIEIRKQSSRFEQSPGGPDADRKSASVYIIVEGFRPDSGPRTSTRVKVRISADHESDNWVTGTTQKDGWTEIVILHDIDDVMRVVGKDGIEHEWSSLDWKTARVPLINGRDADLGSGVWIRAKDAKYSFCPQKQNLVYAVIGRVRNEIMDAIHVHVHSSGI